MDAINITSFSAAIASLVLAVVAIWLSVFFYRMSSEIAESTKEAAKGIGASVDRLEKLFDKLYADTFSMMKDTVSDMRKHIWPEGKDADDKIAQEAERRTDEKVKALKTDIERELSELLQRQQITDERMSTMRDELAHVMDRAIAESRRLEVEAREETVRDKILEAIRALQRLSAQPTAEAIVSSLDIMFPFASIIQELENMKREGVLNYADETLRSDTVIHLPLP